MELTIHMIISVQCEHASCHWISEVAWFFLQIRTAEHRN